MDIVIKNKTKHKLFVTINLKAHYIVQPNDGETRSIRLDDILERSTMEISIWSEEKEGTKELEINDPYKWLRGYANYVRRANKAVDKWLERANKLYPRSLIPPVDVDVDGSFNRGCEEKGGQVKVGKDGKLWCIDRTINNE